MELDNKNNLKIKFKIFLFFFAFFFKEFFFVCCGCTSTNKLIFLQPKRKFCTLLLSKRFINCSASKKTSITPQPICFRHLADVKADICNLPFEDNQYDVILCNHVLEHIPDDTKAMQELFRVLKPAAMAILQIPQDLKRDVTFADDSITDQKRTRPKYLVNTITFAFMVAIILTNSRSIGFKVIEEDYTNKIAPELVEKYCLAKGEIIPVCFK